ncbi:hypothetical protein G6F46_014608 [Rhizopus delemar]|nr:hypothetical protein G6F46_014608 [Rhizopus delemar]
MPRGDHRRRGVPAPAAESTQAGAAPGDSRYGGSTQHRRLNASTRDIDRRITAAASAMPEHPEGPARSAACARVPCADAANGTPAPVPAPRSGGWRVTPPIPGCAHWRQ